MTATPMLTVIATAWPSTVSDSRRIEAHRSSARARAHATAAILDEQRKIVGVEPRDEPARPLLRGDVARDAAQDGIAGFGAQRLVEHAKLVDVDPRAPRAPHQYRGNGQQRIEAALELPSRQQARQGIVTALDQLRGLFGNRDQQVLVAVSEVDRLRKEFTMTSTPHTASLPLRTGAAASLIGPNRASCGASLMSSLQTTVRSCRTHSSKNSEPTTRRNSAISLSG